MYQLQGIQLLVTGAASASTGNKTKDDTGDRTKNRTGDSEHGFLLWRKTSATVK